MAYKTSIHLRPAALAAAFILLLPAAPGASADLAGFIAIPDLPELADRARAFRRALGEITVDPVPPPSLTTASARDVLNLQSSFRFTDALLAPSLDEPPGLPGRRDLVFEEQWLLAGREDDHQRAARHWLGRRLKGSDRRARSGGSAVRTQFAWDHGPLVGLGGGPFSVRAGASQWRLQWSKRWSRSQGAWRSRVWVGEDEGEFEARFLIGRSLLDSYGR